MEAVRERYPKTNNIYLKRFRGSLVALFCCFSFWCICQPLPRSVNQECVLYIAKSQLGVTENPSNWGRDVSAYLRSVGIRFPAAWCGAYVYWCYMMYSCDINLNHLKLGYVPNWSRGEMAQYVVWDKRTSEVKIQDFDFQPGDLCTIYFQSMKREAHIFMVLEKSNGQLITIEGNTNDGGSRDGYGVFIRQRSLSSVHKVIRLIP
jgi:hypothetical protein